MAVWSSEVEDTLTLDVEDPIHNGHEQNIWWWREERENNSATDTNTAMPRQTDLRPEGRTRRAFASGLRRFPCRSCIAYSPGSFFLARTPSTDYRKGPAAGESLVNARSDCNPSPTPHIFTALGASCLSTSKHSTHGLRGPVETFDQGLPWTCFDPLIWFLHNWLFQLSLLMRQSCT